MRLDGLWWWIDRWRKSTAYTDMTLEEQGAYRNLLDEANLRGGALPNDERILAKACGDALAWKRVRAAVMARFELREGCWHNRTLDEVIQESMRRAKSQSENGRKGAAARWSRNGQTNGRANGDSDGQADGQADGEANGQYGSEAVSTKWPPDPDLGPDPSPDLDQTQRARAPATTLRPKHLDKTHDAHVWTLCDFCCLPRFLLDQFARNADWTAADVVAWATGIRDVWQGGARGDSLDFWRARYRERFPQAPVQALKMTKDQRTIEAGKRWLSTRS